MSEKKLPGLEEMLGKAQRCQETAAAPAQWLQAAEWSGWDHVAQGRAANPSFVTVQEETSKAT